MEDPATYFTHLPPYGQLLTGKKLHTLVFHVN